MTAKRFKISIGELEEENISDTVKNIEITEISDMCTQMNTLYEENEQLKQTVSDWSGSYDELFEDVKRLEEENEQLKKLNIPIDEIKDTVIDYRGRIIGVYYND